MARKPVGAYLEWTADKLLKGAGAGADPTEIDISDCQIPSGLISMWHGTIANIPAGWILCDGGNGTPNLLAKFVEGVAAADTDPGTTGGATAKTTAGHVHSGPNHKHTGPSHQHTLPIGASNASPSSIAWKTQWSGTFTPARYSGIGGAYTTSSNRLISDAAGTGNTGYGGTGNTGSKTDSISDIRPKFYDVAFIMKT